MIPDRKDAGAALLSILLIIATLSVAALMATEAIARQTELHKLGSRRATALWAMRSAETAAISGARNLVEASRLPANGEDGARTAEFALPVEGGSVHMTVQEQPPCLNLNALASSDPSVHKRAADGLRILLEDAGVPTVEALRAVGVLSDWIDGDQDTRPYGAEDAAYLSLEYPFRPANQSLVDISELAAIPEFTPALRKALAPFVCALPHADLAAINVNALNAASAPVLRASAAGGATTLEIRRFIEARPASGWRDVQSVRDALADRPQLEAALSGVSLMAQGEYFSGVGTAALDAGHWNFRFTISAETGRAPKIIYRDFGGTL